MRSGTRLVHADVRRFRADARGATLTEFGLISPVLCLLLMGVFDFGHTLYMRAVLHGAVQKASRDSGLQTGSVAASQAAIDAAVRSQVRRLANSATVNIDRRMYRSFSQAQAARAEPFTDTNRNGRCDGEPYEDWNNNNVRDADGGSAGQGGAKDTVVYSVTVAYRRMFPVHGIIGGSPTTSIKSTTILANQPYGEQGVDAPMTSRTCPAV